MAAAEGPLGRLRVRVRILTPPSCPPHLCDNTQHQRQRQQHNNNNKPATNQQNTVLLPFTCGVDADQGASAGGLATQAALMARARALGLRPRAFTRPTERFEAADLDRHDVVVAVDAATKAAVLRLVDPRYRDHYDQHVRLLSEYAASDAVLPAARVLRQGGLALLPRDMAAGLAARRPLAALRATRDVPRPDLTDASAAASARFDEMVALATLGCAGLAAHLIDSYPDDLPDYDPL